MGLNDTIRVGCPVQCQCRCSTNMSAAVIFNSVNWCIYVFVLRQGVRFGGAFFGHVSLNLLDLMVIGKQPRIFEMEILQKRTVCYMVPHDFLSLT